MQGGIHRPRGTSCDALNTSRAYPRSLAALLQLLLHCMQLKSGKHLAVRQQLRLWNLTLISELKTVHTRGTHGSIIGTSTFLTWAVAVGGTGKGRYSGAKQA